MSHECENCGSQDHHVVAMESLGSIDIRMPAIQKLRILDQDGKEVLCVMNQSGDMIVWLQNDAIAEIIESNPGS